MPDGSVRLIVMMKYISGIYQTALSGTFIVMWR